MENKSYICIDLKSFYATAECAERGLDPFCTNLVVADPCKKYHMFGNHTGDETGRGKKSLQNP